ncbi:helix-turn-helix domain-containing protein [Methylophilus sp. YYY-1]|uniref:helix-turn-helix domain-containing protein n=1 Tax=Methylophilus sp. YYY-1 TaxID=2682087 RepID=UPI0023B2D8BA|nr:helix-turn-helix domain-containing protein [Methylophilus sp. YYY-1]MDF0379365.1 helix-turn-helix domain-containing protein [Methylophilus sp. YYY-1]
MQIITAQQSRDARRELGLSQAEVAKQLDLNRQYLSEFETGFSTRLTSSQLKKLRTFYEEKITDANANGEKIEITFGEESASTLEPPKVEHFTARRLTIPIAENISLETLSASLQMIKDNEARIATLLDQPTERNSGFIGSGEFTEACKENLQEIYGLLSLNSIVYLTLGGSSALKIPPGTESLESLRDIVFESFKPQLETAGLFMTVEEDAE